MLMIFVDGLGIGRHDPAWNPCSAEGLRFFNNFADRQRPEPVPFGGMVLGLDATLGLPGLPQSATGQTALLTGVNAAQLLGRHLNGFPNGKLREVIAQHSLLKLLAERGRKVAFLNAFRPPFFDYDPFQIIRHLSVTSVCNLYAGLRFFDLDDLRARRCIYQDFSNEALRRRGYELPLFSPEEAGTILGTQAAAYDFCLYEYFQTDRAGHAQETSTAVQLLRDLERFVAATLQSVDLQETLVVLTSDHGNIEDLSVKGHTRNPAMTLIWGRGKEDFASGMSSILDVAPKILELLG
ncbi:MAG: alkaline phosphatase family protein [Calditrichaeota bacterium]|nr:alkaline phosphatase family protein [Calditrichota bacterium]